MRSKKEPPRSPAKLARQSETQLSLLPDDIGTRKKPRAARLPDGREDSRTAEVAAFHESRALEKFLKRMGYTADEWEKRRRHYLEAPLSDEELNSLTWKAAKVRHSGRATVERALQRQKTLRPDLWLLAFLIAEGDKRKDIPHIMCLKKRRVAMLISELRAIVYKETHSSTDGTIARWFLGL